MKYEIKDIIEYTIALITAFAKRFNLSENQAYKYIRFHKGIQFLQEHYGIIHTLDFQEAVESVAIYCRKTGGEL